jgi:hypothetical protein
VPGEWDDCDDRQPFGGALQPLPDSAVSGPHQRALYLPDEQPVYFDEDASPDDIRDRDAKRELLYITEKVNEYYHRVSSLWQKANTPEEGRADHFLRTILPIFYSEGKILTTATIPATIGDTPKRWYPYVEFLEYDGAGEELQRWFREVLLIYQVGLAGPTLSTAEDKV